jgi:hypothetical protein|tara:strand:- start:12063 stop:12542 length:480 start_codon:yes stop_codon:yes gene_type:complete
MLRFVVSFVLGLGATFLLLSAKKMKLSKDGVGITKFLMSLGYSKANASGIAGNLFVESSFNPTAIGDNGTSFGLAQWHKSRWDRLNSWAETNKLNPSTFETQLKYIDWELNNKEKRAKEKLLETNNPYDSAFAFAKYYERPAKISEKRMIKAQEIYNKI